jgi:hypothetical protein
MKLLQELMEANVIDASSRFGRHEPVVQNQNDIDPNDQFVNSMMSNDIEHAKRDYDRLLVPLMHQAENSKVFGMNQIAHLYQQMRKVRGDVWKLPEDSRRALYVLAQNHQYVGLLSELNNVTNQLDDRHNGIIKTEFGSKGLFKFINIYKMLIKARDSM